MDFLWSGNQGGGQVAGSKGTPAERKAVMVCPPDPGPHRDLKDKHQEAVEEVPEVLRCEARPDTKTMMGQERHMTSRP